ncbi:MAG: HupE/UreJ family protein [Sphingobacteriaceae bacterium]|jgi:hypothetical protein
MYNEFISFFKTGWHHIVDINAYDHLLFVMTLCAAFKLPQWKQILIIITAFSIGHATTLVLAVFDFIPTNTKLVDTLIPITIMVTALTNVVFYNKETRFSNTKIKYAIALGFGLIHGLAFANNFKFMLFGGNLIWTLFSFNIGIEAGQVFIVALFMMALFVYTKYLKGNHQSWNVFISGAGFGIAATILLKTLQSN